MIPRNIIIACAAYFVVCGLIFFAIHDTSPIVSLTPNLFAGAIDAIFAVVLISYLLAKHSQREYRPLRFAAYLKAESAIRILQLTWFDMIKASSTEMPAIGEDLLAEKYFDQVAEHLDLDQPSMGANSSSWLSRATSAGIIVKDAIGTMTSRFASALSPEMIAQCTETENCGMISVLGSLATMNTNFVIKGTTMQKPFIFAHAKDSIPILKQFIAMTSDISKEFASEKGYKKLASFIVTAEMAKGDNSLSALSSARVE